MLAESVHDIVGDSMSLGTTALHLAARRDHDLIAAQLLTEDPSLADAIDVHHQDALRIAANYGSEKVVDVLLAKSPHVIHTVDDIGKTALHYAAIGGHHKIVAQLLAADPKLANAADSSGWTPLHSAALTGREVVADMLLAVNPQSIFSVGTYGTVLHLACASRSQTKEFFSGLLELNPGALRAVDSSSITPFEIVVAKHNDSAIEVLQKELTFDEIMNTFTKHTYNFEERLRPIVEGQCACLVESLLNRDVVGIVFEYLGFSCRGATQQAEGESPTVSNEECCAIHL